jgi:multiple sugar transport system permease protein
MTRRRIQNTLIYIVLIALAALFVFPVLIIFTNSFMSGFEIFNRYTNLVGAGNIHNSVDGINYVRFTLIPDFISLEQYSRLFFYRPHYLGSFWNSVVLALPVVIGQILISAPAAYAFEMSRFHHKEKVYFAYIVIMLLPLQVTLVPNFIMADWLGILDTRAAVILPAMLNPFGVFLMRQYFRGLSADYVEAAQVDGATHLRIIFSIVVPMFKPALAALIILTFVNNWNIVEQAIIFLSPEQGPLSVYLSRIAADNLEMIFAASFFYLIPPLMMFLYWKEHMVEGISLSGIR